MIDAIDAYRARGWVPVPLHPGTKRPMAEGFLRATVTDPWPSTPCNVGLLLGAPSGGLIDVDLDCREAVELADVLPPTLSFSRSPDSAHRWYICPAIDARATWEHEGMIVEIRSTGGQTMVPPSVHPDGDRLQWGPWVEPAIIDTDDLRRRVGAVAALALVARHWPAGGRHQAQLALAGCLLSEGWTEDETIEALCAVCRIAGDEDRPKRIATVRSTVERIAACEEITGWGTLAAALPVEVAKVARGWLGGRRLEVVDRERLEGLAATWARSNNEARKHLGRTLRRVALGERVPGDLGDVARAVGAAFPDADPEVLAKTFAGSTETPMDRAIERGQQEAQRRDAVAFERGDHTELARRVRAVLSRAGELAHDEGRLWRCTEGVWRAVDDAEIDGAVMAFAGAPVRGGTSPLRVDARDILAVRRTTLPALCARPGWFAAAPPGVAFLDRFVGRDGDEPLTSAHRCRAAHPFAWDPAARADGWRAFLAETYADPAVAAFLAEFVGACLLGVATMFQRFVVLYGDGGTGKSQVVRVVSGLMPAGTVGSIPPHEWQREYYRARLVGLRLNAVSEMPATEIFDAESIKAIVSGDAVSARRPYEPPFDLSARAGHLFAANELPPVRDMSRGFWRRVTCIDHVQTPTDPVADLAEALLEVELPGIVAWAVEGGRRALARGAYALPGGETVDRWRVESDSVALWVEDRVEFTGSTPAAELYDDYRVHALTAGQKPVSGVVFGRRLGRLGATVTREGKGRIRTWTARIRDRS